MRVSRRALLSGAAAGLVAPAAFARPPEVSLRPLMRNRMRALDALIASAGLSGKVICAVADVSTGAVLESVGGQMGLPPASVAKALTALYALDVLGPGHRFATRVLANGVLKDGVLDGDLILAGGGNPVLDTKALAELASDLKAIGLREVRGAFKVYDGALPYVHSIDPGQPDHLGYSPSVSGIALNFNRVHFEWVRGASGYSVTMDARAANYKPQVAMAQMQVIARRVPVYTYEDTPRIDRWTVARGALGNGGSRWLPVRKPALYAGDVFQTLARSHGIVLGRVQVIDRAPLRAQVLVKHESAPLVDLLRGMLKYSTNLTAEMVGMAASARRAGTPADLAASAAVMNRWAADKLGMTQAAMVDHSGLSGASRLTPEDLALALARVHQAQELRPLLKPFVLRDAKGGLDRAHPIRVDAKTGTLNFVSGLGGYMTAAGGADLSFAIFTADTAKRSRIRRADREVPQGARPWNRQSRRLQQMLIERWGSLYGS